MERGPRLWQGVWWRQEAGAWSWLDETSGEWRVLRAPPGPATPENSPAHKTLIHKVSNLGIAAALTLVLIGAVAHILL